MTDDDEVLACPDCDRTPVVANAPGGRSHGDSEDYRCTRCGWKGDEPRRRERRGDPDLRPDSLAAKLDEADSLDELVTDGGVQETIEVEKLDCLAWIGAEGCENDVVGVEDGVPLCAHHLDRTGVYDYPRVANDELVTDGSADRPHPNARINRNLKHPPIAGAKVGSHPEVDATVYYTAKSALCRACHYPATFVITLPGDAVPLCKKHSGGERGVRDR